MFSIYFSDKVFDENSVTMDVFEDVCKPIVDSALAGFNGNFVVYFVLDDSRG